MRKKVESANIMSVITMSPVGPMMSLCAIVAPQVISTPGILLSIRCTRQCVPSIYWSAAANSSPNFMPTENMRSALSIDLSMPYSCLAYCPMMMTNIKLSENPNALMNV